MKTVYEELQEIEARNGILKPESVVEYARNPTTTLHTQFEWDDAKASEQWRLQQARQIIRVAVTVLPHTETTTRAFVSLKEDRYNGSGYRNIASVLSDEEMRRKLLDEAMEDIKSFRSRYSELKELSAIFSAMEKTEAQLQRQSEPILVA